VIDAPTTGAEEADEADEALMRQVQADDPLAFGLLYDRFSARAYRLASGMAQNRGHAEDMVQEAFVSLWRNRARYDPGRGSVTGWVMTAVRHRAIDVLRAQRRHDAHRARTDQTADEPATAGGAVEDRVIEREGAARLRSALGALPAAQREVITLAYFGELSATEIADRLSLPVGTVKGRMRLGLTKLRHGTER
jgi:RNA polymerase sigma-70 factor (ECF subfamily)